MVEYHMLKKYYDIHVLRLFYIIPERDRRADRRT